MFKWLKYKNLLNKKSQNQAPEKTAPIILTVVDTGDFGFSSCGECGYILLDTIPTHCPFCGIKFSGAGTTPSFGGSDF